MIETHQTVEAVERVVDTGIHRAAGSRSLIRDRIAELPPRNGIHPVVIRIGLGAVGAFLLWVWLAFARDATIDYLLVVASGFLILFFGLLGLTAARAAEDPRWRGRQAAFPAFLDEAIQTATGSVNGREAAIEILIIPVSLALATMAIGLAWMLAQ